MKKRYSFWWVFALMSIVVTFLNPYAEGGDIFDFSDLFFISIMYLILKVNSKELVKYKENKSVTQEKNISFKIASAQTKGIKIAIVVVCIIMFLIKTISGLTSMLFNTGSGFSNVKSGEEAIIIGWICFITSFVLNFVAIYYCIKLFRNKKFDDNEIKEKKKAKKEEIDINNVKEVELSPLDFKCCMILLISIVIAFLNPYYHFFAFLNLWYLFICFIYYINYYWNKELIPKVKDEFLKYNLIRQLYLLVNTKVKIFFISAMAIIGILFNVIKLFFTFGKYLPFTELLQYSFLKQNNWIFMWISVFADVFVVIVFSMKIWKNKFKEENE